METKEKAETLMVIKNHTEAEAKDLERKKFIQIKTLLKIEKPTVTKEIVAKENHSTLKKKTLANANLL